MEGQKATDLANAFRKLYADADDDQATFGRVLDMADQIDALTSSPGWAIVCELVEHVEAQELCDLIGALRPLGQADYAQRLAHVRGLRAALDAPATVRAVVGEIKAKAEARVRALEAIGSG